MYDLYVNDLEHMRSENYVIKLDNVKADQFIGVRNVIVDKISKRVTLSGKSKFCIEMFIVKPCFELQKDLSCG